MVLNLSYENHHYSKEQCITVQTVLSMPCHIDLDELIN